MTVELNSANPSLERAGRRVPFWSHPFLIICLIVFASLAVRVAALAYWGTGAIDSEGSEYARIAQNLRNGTGYVGMTSPGLEIVFPPLFPLLIAAASFITHNYEWACRLVSLLFGSLLPLPVFGIASRLYNRPTGFVAALLIILCPLLVNLSFLALSEGLYITLLLSAVYTVLVALKSPSLRIYAMAGALFALAYLTRQEAVAPLLIALFFIVCFTEGSLATRSKRAAVVLAVFGALALPEVIYLYKATGQIRLEAKSPIFYAQQVRTAIGQENHEPDPGQWAEHSIDSNLQRTGVKNRPEVDVLRETRVNYRQLAHNLKLGMRENIPVLLQQLSSRWMGAPFLTALAFFGALRRPWKRHDVSSHLYVLLVPLTAIVATFSFTGWVTLRYYFVLIPFLLIWAASGLIGVGLWTQASVASAGWHWLRPTIAKWIVPGLIGLVVILYPLGGVRTLSYFAKDSRPNRVVKQVGMWIGQQQDGQVTIMDLATPLAFHANAQWVNFPYCNGDLALRFLDAAKVDYVVLRQREKYTQYYQDWVTNGIPDSRAERVYEASAPDGNNFTVYRWHRKAVP